MKFSKIISVILSLLIVFSFSSCKNKKPSSELEGTSDPNNSTIEKVDGSYIVKDGQSLYSIVISDNPSETEYFSASELRDFVESSIGVVLPIKSDKESSLSNKIISIGYTAFVSSSIKKDVEKLGTDGFIMKTDDDDLFIVGENEAGTLYGTYDFIERFLGVRFLADDYTYIPSISELPLYNLNIADSPAVDRRYYMAGGATGDSSKLAIFHARARLASNYGSNATYGSSTDWCIEAGMSHNICVDLVKPSEWEESHPEWFYSEHGLKDICWSNGLTDDAEVDNSMDLSVFKVALNDLKKFAQNADENVDKYVFGHWDVGAGNKGCQCDRCKLLQEKYGYGGMQIRFVNVLARELNKWSMETLGKPAYVICWAYHISSQAPVKETAKGGWEPIDETVRANDNVIIYYAPIEADRNYALLDKNQKIYTHDNVAQWKAVAKKFIFWTYDVNFPEYFVYTPRLHTYQEDVKLYEEMGAKYIQVQSNWDTNNIWFTLMGKYVAAKLLWNPDQDVNALKEEWISLYYGPAGNDINELVRRYEETWFAISAEDPLFSTRYSDMSANLARNASVVLLGLQDLCDDGIEKIKASNLTEEEKADFIRRVEGVKFTFMFLELDQYEMYHHTSLLGRYDLAVEVFALAEKLGIDKYCEGTKIDNLRATYLG